MAIDDTLQKINYLLDAGFGGAWDLVRSDTADRGLEILRQRTRVRVGCCGGGTQASLGRVGPVKTFGRVITGSLARLWEGKTPQIVGAPIPPGSIGNVSPGSVGASSPGPAVMLALPLLTPGAFVLGKIPVGGGNSLYDALRPEPESTNYRLGVVAGVSAGLYAGVGYGLWKLFK